MASDRHRGAVAPGPLVQHPDRRVSELDAAVRHLEAVSPQLPGFTPTRDPFRALQGGGTSLADVVPGVVVYSAPHLGCYRVQLGQMRGTKLCCMLSPGGFAPLGVRDTSAIPPNSSVLVFDPKWSAYGYILGVVPPLLTSGTLPNPDWLSYASGAGYQHERGHRYVLSDLHQGGGLLDFSGQRPVDCTAFERGWSSATGIALALSDFEAFLRVNEQCGLFLSYFDSHARLSGFQLDVTSAVHEVSARDDEGESRLFTGVALYPHEALGLYARGGGLYADRTDEEVQFGGPASPVDQAHPDAQPLYRWQEYGGYLGQGHLRLLVKPAAEAGVRRYQDRAPDTGLFMESVAADGDYLVQSAKSITLAKRCKVFSPRQAAPPEHGPADDAAAGNYRFSGLGEGGAEHRLAEVAVGGDQKAARRSAAVDDLAAFGANWKAAHPFHYHAGDFHTPSEGEAGVFDRAQERLDFRDASWLDDPAPRKVRIDHRYNDAEYFERTSLISMLADGGIVLADGFGAAIRMTGGRVRIEAPLGVEVCPGTDFVVAADQVVIKALRSVDVSASKNDVRIKAEKNVQVLAGNGGVGGILLESKATGKAQRYSGKIGEDVASSGVVVKAPGSSFAALAGEVYLRTGGEGLDAGDVVLDAGKGSGRVEVYAAAVDAYCSESVGFYFGPSGETSEVKASYRFAPGSCLMDAQLVLGGALVGFSGKGGQAGVIVDGSIEATGSAAVAGLVAGGQGGFVAKVPDRFAGNVTRQTGAAAAFPARVNEAAGKAHEAAVVGAFYGEGRVGSDATVKAIGFTFRDSDGDRQYATSDLTWAERRWEQMARFGLATGGTAWEEKPVVHEGVETYPWPGRTKWKVDRAFLRLAENTMYDPAAGRAKDRPRVDPATGLEDGHNPYAEPALAGWDAVTMEEGYKSVRG